MSEMSVWGRAREFGEVPLFAGFVGVLASITSVLIDRVIKALASSSSWQHEA